MPRFSPNFNLTSNQGPGNYDVRCDIGGRYKLMARATWGGGNVKLQLSIQGTYVDMPSSTLSADGMLDVVIPDNTDLRLVVTTATATFVSLRRVSDEY